MPQDSCPKGNRLVVDRVGELCMAAFVCMQATLSPIEEAQCFSNTEIILSSMSQRPMQSNDSGELKGSCVRYTVAYK